MSKTTTTITTLIVLVVALLLFASLTYAARPDSVLPNHNSPVETKNVDPEANNAAHEVDSCKGLGEEECLMTRSLDAHTDYIYTQDINP
ncbi:phytosulfokines 3-like [Macadamia integrifolia]|uniref:phytosulfokines 3-like n=1 Tax=Macadamia integrifolia TaxID=60698 RepID=UPI001C502673|nr:phytosulfokines 3-like [Macadamia integrifolia]